MAETTTTKKALSADQARINAAKEAGISVEEFGKLPAKVQTMMEKKASDDYSRRQSQADRPLRCQISEKKAVSVYGLGRFPVTLYYSQWMKFFTYVETVKAFVIKAHADGLLSVRDEE